MVLQVLIDRGSENECVVANALFLRHRLDFADLENRRKQAHNEDPREGKAPAELSLLALFLTQSRLVAIWRRVES